MTSLRRDARARTRVASRRPDPRPSPSAAAASASWSPAWSDERDGRPANTGHPTPSEPKPAPCRRAPEMWSRRPAPPPGRGTVVAPMRARSGWPSRDRTRRRQRTGWCA